MIKLTNPAVRNVLYVVYAVASMALGSIVVFCGASDVYTLPSWVTPAAAVLAYVGSGLGFIASANTPAPAPAEAPEPGTVPAA